MIRNEKSYEETHLLYSLWNMYRKGLYTINYQ